MNRQIALRLLVLLNFFYYIFHICYCLAEHFIIILENILIVFESSVSVGILLSPLILMDYLFLIGYIFKFFIEQLVASYQDQSTKPGGHRFR